MEAEIQSNTTLATSQIILGCGNFGGIGSMPELKGLGESKKQAFKLLELARELGINKFDTANTYGGGLSEAFLGEWVSRQKPNYRASIQIHTKVGNPSGVSKGETPLSANEIDLHLRASLNRLRTEYIDLFYIHEPDQLTPIEETIAALLKYIKSGEIRRLGLSNVSLDYVQKCISVLGTIGFKYLFGVQNEFNYLKQTDGEKLIPYLRSLGLKYVAYSPLSGGLLSGKYNLGHPFPPGSRLSLRPEPYKNLITHESFEKITDLSLRALSRKRQLPEEAIRFLVEDTAIDFVVIGPRRKEHYENFGFKFN